MKLEDISRRESEAAIKLPDGPQTPPFVQLIQWMTRPLEFMDTCTKHYGDIFTVRLGSSKPIVFLSNPLAIQQVFTTDSKQFEVGKGNTTQSII